MAYVLKGRVTSKLASGPAVTYAPGQSWFEPAGIVHEFAENASTTDDAVILAVFVAPKCAELTTFLHKDAGAAGESR